MKVEISVPTELSEMTLGQYQKYIEIANDNEDSEFLHHKMVEIFCGIDLKNVSKMKYKDVQFIISSMANLFKGTYKLVPTFKMGGVEFGFIPNLEEISSGEYMDIDNYITDWQEIHKAMAAMYRPITRKVGSKYQIEDYNGSVTYAEVMKQAPLHVVFGSVVFFYHLGNELLSSLMDYLEANKEAMNILNQANLEKGGDGILLSMLLVKEMLEDLMKFPNFHYTSA